MKWQIVSRLYVIKVLFFGLLSCKNVGQWKHWNHWLNNIQHAFIWQTFDFWSKIIHLTSPEQPTERLKFQSLSPFSNKTGPFYSKLEDFSVSRTIWCVWRDVLTPSTCPPHPGLCLGRQESHEGVHCHGFRDFWWFWFVIVLNCLDCCDLFVVIHVLWFQAELHPVLCSCTPCPHLSFFTPCPASLIVSS